MFSPLTHIVLRLGVHFVFILFLFDDLRSPHAWMSLAPEDSPCHFFFFFRVLLFFFLLTSVLNHSINKLNEKLFDFENIMSTMNALKNTIFCFFLGRGMKI